MYFLVVIAVVISAIIIFLALTYYRLIKKSKDVKVAKDNLDEQLSIRFKMFEDLIKSIGNPLYFEQTILKDIIKLRSEAQASKIIGDISSQIDSEEKIGKITKQIELVFQSYNELRFMKNANDIQNTILEQEKKVSQFKDIYFNSVQNYNRLKMSWQGLVLNSLFSNKFQLEMKKRYTQVSINT